MRIWKRNVVVSTIVLFVCVALYLSWSYGRTPAEGDAAVFDPVGGQTEAGASTGESLDAGLHSPGADAETGGESKAQEELSNGYFAQARLNRQQTRDSAIAILREASEREGASQEIKENAVGEIEKLVQNAMLESTIENLIVAKGFAECVAFINNDGIDIVVSEPVEGMSETDTAKITDIILSQTAMTALDIHVVSVPA